VKNVNPESASVHTPPSRRAPAPVGAPAAAAASQTSSDAPGSSPLQALARRAAQVRREHASEDDRPADWADPDAGALLALPEQQHPVRRALRRSKAGPTRANFGSLLRRSAEILAGAEPGSMTVEDMLGYPWHLIDEEAAESFRREVYRRYTNQGTRNDYQCAVRRVVDECHRKRLISPLRRQILFEALYTVAPGRSRRRRRLTAEDTQALLTAATAHPRPDRAARDTAMVALIRATGLRGAELAGIDLADWDRADANVWIRNRKNGRDLLVFLPPAVAPYLDRWRQVRGDAPGPLFTRLNQQDRSRPLTPAGIRYILKLVATNAGVTWMGSHDYRRTFATEMLERHDPVLVSELLGHEKVDSTRIYDLRGDDALRAAVTQVPLPDLDALLRQAAGAEGRARPEAVA
jgi:integrase